MLLPQRWIDAKGAIDQVMAMNFVSTSDIGGNSGAPTVNGKGELVGIVFDGNLEAIPLTYLYLDDQARAVHMSTQGIVEALPKVYKSNGLLHELGVPESKGGTE